MVEALNLDNIVVIILQENENPEVKRIQPKINSKVETLYKMKNLEQL